MGFGTQQQLGNRSGITNQTSLADLFGGLNNGGQSAGGGQNELFTLLQQLLGGQGGFQADPVAASAGGFNRPGMTPPALDNPLMPEMGGDMMTPPVRNNPLMPGLGGDQSIMPVPPQINGMPPGGTPLTSLSNPFAQLINQRAIR